MICILLLATARTLENPTNQGFDWNAVSALATAGGLLLGIFAAWFVVLQLREMRRATLAQTFWPIALYLQSAECRGARRVALNIADTEFSKWTDEEKGQAEVAGNAYDLVGILFRSTQLNHKVISGEWRVSIIRCWNKLEPMVKVYRAQRDENYWNDFEWLYQQAL